MSEERDNREVVGRVPPRGASPFPTSAASDVGRVPSHGAPELEESLPRRLRRLHRAWPDRDGNISYLLTPCVDGRAHVLDNEITFERFVAFLLDSPKRYHWFGRHFVIMPDHIHLIAHMGHNAVRLGQWIKPLKAVVAGLERRKPTPVAASEDAAYHKSPPAGAIVGGVPSQVGQSQIQGAHPHEFTRIKRAWRWQDGFHDHKFRTPESEARTWEYVCLNPVRAGLVKRPEERPYGGEIFYGESVGPRLVRGVPPLLETGWVIEEAGGTPREGTRPTP